MAIIRNHFLQRNARQMNTHSCIRYSRQNKSVFRGPDTKLIAIARSKHASETRNSNELCWSHHKTERINFELVIAIVFIMDTPNELKVQLLRNKGGLDKKIDQSRYYIPHISFFAAGDTTIPHPIYKTRWDRLQSSSLHFLSLTKNRFAHSSWQKESIPFELSFSEFCWNWIKFSHHLYSVEGH